MKCFLTLVLCLKIVMIYAVPLQMQWQSQMSVQPTQEEILQDQLLALQEMQLMNQYPNYGYPPLMQKSEPPYIIIIPIDKSDTMSDINSMLKNAIDNEVKDKETNDRITENKDLDSITIEAAEPTPGSEPKRAILLIPNRGRFSIGGLISAIPFLPIEINIPDTISWIYNGISGIISGLGQRFPFNRPSQTQNMPRENMKILLKRLQTKNQSKPTPILMLPEVAQMYPMFA